MSGGAQREDATERYAHALLKAAISADIHVLGLTPHSARLDGGRGGSAVWTALDIWSNGVDAEGVPYRESIYAIFPGFEPSLNDGASGLHLLFLFDPEIGFQNYTKAFDLVMGAANPWEGGQLQVSSKTSKEALKDLRDFHRRELKNSSQDTAWQYLVLAPHINDKKGLLGAKKAQVLELFGHEHIAGLELPDNALPEEVTAKRPWLVDGMKRHLQCFFHSSDAYGLEPLSDGVPQCLGYRFTWVKLASPRIEGLRQAFIASDSRVRLGYRRSEGQGLQVAEQHPDPRVGGRPWIKSMTVSGGNSFFGGANGTDSTRVFFSPDLTCVIGGSMTGKSTLLDGLRSELGAALPTDETLAAMVRERTARVLKPDSLSTVIIDYQGTTKGLEASFFAQGELRLVSDDDRAIEVLLSSLDGGERQGISARATRLAELDASLKNAAESMEGLYERQSELAQQLSSAQDAQRALKAFKKAGADRLHVAAQSRADLDNAKAFVELRVEEAIALSNRVAEFKAEDARDAADDSYRASGIAVPDIPSMHEIVKKSLGEATQSLRALAGIVEEARSSAVRRESVLVAEIEAELLRENLAASVLHRLTKLTDEAATAKSTGRDLESHSERVRNAEGNFENLINERNAALEKQRAAFARVIRRIETARSGDIRVTQCESGDPTPLEDFLLAFRQKGITGWWNAARKQSRHPSVEQLLESLEADTLGNLGMSDVVGAAFKAAMTPAWKKRLAALRCQDTFEVSVRVGAGSFRPLKQLSGGRRVATLLWLLLDADDQRPLLIDQPEDELDNSFLWKSLIPALRALKGKRQIILVTHNPNIVVNADADQVVQLDATADRGYVEVQGAIENPAVRGAIVDTVDGGRDAFELRRAKYGF